MILKALATFALLFSLAGQIYAVQEMMMCESGRLDSNYCAVKGTMNDCFALPKSVTFKTKFLRAPEVTLGLTKLNIDNGDNTRVRLDETVTTGGLSLTFVCMWGTGGARGHCYSASANWMACGVVDVEAWNQANHG